MRVKPHERWKRNRTCWRKVRHYVKEHAEEIMRRLKVVPGEIMHVYQCPYCSWWHIGHRNKPLDTRQRIG